MIYSKIKKVSGIVLLLLAMVFCVESAAALSVADVKVGPERTLTNGLVCRKYTFSKRFHITDQTMCLGTTCEYDIEWPVSGDKEAVNAIRSWILGYLKKVDNRNISIPSNSSIQEAIIKRALYIKNNYDEELGSDTFSGTLSVTSLGMIEASVDFDTRYCMQNSRTEEYYTETFNVKKGSKKFSKEMLPDIAIIRPLLFKHLVDCDGVAILRSDVSVYIDDKNLLKDNLEYPNALPTFTEKGLDFVWNIYELGPPSSAGFSSLIPYDELLPIASPELLEFIPESHK